MYQVVGTADLGKQGFKPKGRTANGRDRTGVCCVAWYTAKRDNKTVRVGVTAWGYAILKDNEAVGYGQPYYTVDPVGVVTAYRIKEGE